MPPKNKTSCLCAPFARAKGPAFYSADFAESQLAKTPRLASAASRILAVLAMVVWFVASVAQAHQLTFNSTITYSAVQPSGAADSVAQWSGAAFDAANIGGSGVNADGGANNGTA